MASNVETEICKYLHQLSPEHQRDVLEFVRALAGASVRGRPGQTLLRFAGAIDVSDLTMMAQAIEDECEQIDDDW